MLVAWVFAVSFLGVWVGWYLRGRLIVGSPLVFPAGVATAETLKDVFSHGPEAARRVSALLGSIALAIAVNTIDTLFWRIPRWAPSLGAERFTFSLDPSLLLLGFGGIIGLRAGIGLLVGAGVAWGVIAPQLVVSDIVGVSDAHNWFQPLVAWLLWPGVTLMVTASLTSFALGLVRSLRTGDQYGTAGTAHPGRKLRLAGFFIAATLVVVLQIAFFDIHWTMAVIAIPMAFVLASVAARVAGETGIPPIGAIGKVSQLSFGVLAPMQPITNLMTANVAGGAAGQSADLLNDMRAGYIVGASPGRQVLAQCAGVLTGSIVGSLVYLAMIDDPVSQLLTSEWPAPAVATWKAVAQTLSAGLQGIPASAVSAMGIAAIAGVVLALLEQRLTARSLVWLPSGAAMGLAFVIPASTSLTLFVGALLASTLNRIAPRWSARFLLSIAAGLVAGESMFGVVSMWF
jgi:uncharacterized oligopeptide transporter (OPT) family protein